MHAHARFLGHILRVWPHTSAQRREHNATQLQQPPQQSDARTHHSSNPRSRSLRHVPAVCPSQRSYCAFQAGAGTEQGWHGPFAGASWRVTRRSAPLERPWSPMLACVSARKTNCIARLRLARSGTDTPCCTPYHRLHALNRVLRQVLVGKRARLITKLVNRQLQHGQCGVLCKSRRAVRHAHAQASRELRGAVVVVP